MKKLFLPILLLTSLFAEEKTFVREYTYQASEYDSKVTSRVNALEQVKRLLLEEVSVFILSEVDWTQEETIIDGKSTMKEVYEQNIKSITAGITETKVIDEKWNGETYWLKAEIILNPDDIKLKIEAIVKDREKLKELEDEIKMSKDAFAELEKIKKELAEAKSETEKLKLNKAYMEEADIITAVDWSERGGMAYKNKQYEKAISFYLRALELKPDYHKAYFNLGLAYYFHDNKTKTVEIWEDIIDNYSGENVKVLSQAYSALAIIYADQNEYKNYPKAIQYCEKAIELEKENSTPYWFLGHIYEGLGNIKQQAFYYKEAARLGEKEAQDWLEERGYEW